MYTTYTQNVKSSIKGFLDINQVLNCVNPPLFYFFLPLKVFTSKYLRPSNVYSEKYKKKYSVK